MKVMKFFGILCVVASVVGCGQSWNGPSEVTLTNGSILTCEKSIYIDTSDPFIRCYHENGLLTKIPWNQVVGLRKILPK